MVPVRCFPYTVRGPPEKGAWAGTAQEGAPGGYENGVTSLAARPANPGLAEAGWAPRCLPGCLYAFHVELLLDNNGFYQAFDEAGHLAEEGSGVTGFAHVFGQIALAPLREPRSEAWGEAAVEHRIHRR
jgi:hypothetical protein